ncbi:MAG TPA: hypothetical protein DCY13_24655 [Verrucomicrobiales bacterium]|nr:hypothetical protein [Verrucomicrobiales bacterium]
MPPLTVQQLSDTPMKTKLLRLVPVLPLLFAGCAHRGDSGWITLFPDDGVPAGWVVRNWADVKDPTPQPVVWEVKDGILHGGEPRGSWLLSDREYGDFVIEFEFKLGERGNSGLALRTPMAGDPAFDAIELQMADFRYNTEAKDSELTGGIYRAIAPIKQVYRPTEWNRYRVELRGPSLKAWLNGELIQDVNLDQATADVKRHNGTDAVPLSQRPRRGHIGFQELSRDGASVMIRGARIRELK